MQCNYIGKMQEKYVSFWDDICMDGHVELCGTLCVQSKDDDDGMLVAVNDPQ